MKKNIAMKAVAALLIIGIAFLAATAISEFAGLQGSDQLMPNAIADDNPKNCPEPDACPDLPQCCPSLGGG